jgi:hypothetical protein
VWARLLQDIEGGTDKLVAYIESLPKGRCITITTSDSAIAKSRPIGPRIYAALELMGAKSPCDVVGYRNPFIFIGCKGAPAGSAAFALDVHSQSKTILRVHSNLVMKAAGECTPPAGGGGRRAPPPPPPLSRRHRMCFAVRVACLVCGVYACMLCV